jgi:ribose transport system substrate-binding protein
VLGVLLAVAALAVAACGSSSSSSSTSPGSSSSAASTSSASNVSSVTPPLPRFPPLAGAVTFTPVTPGSGKGLKIGYISLSEAVPFIHLVTLSIRQQAQRAGVQLVFCDARNDAATALACAKTMAVQHVQGLIDYQADATAAPQICAAGPQVPVIGLYIHQPPCEKAYIGANDSYAGKIAGEAVGNYFKQRFGCKYDAYISLQGYETGELNTLRMGGFDQGFSSICGGIHNEKKIQADRIDQAQAAFTNVLTGLPGAHRIIVVGIDDDGIEGALAAAKAQNRVNDLYVAGQGADPSSWCDIKSDPQWIGDTAYFPEKTGDSVIADMIRLIKGQSVPKTNYVPNTVVNGQNIETYYHPSGC